MILALHLLIVQYTTWVFVSSSTFPNPLWVVAAKAALFKDFLHINVARGFSGMH